jgi:hypothetical protein
MQVENGRHFRSFNVFICVVISKDRDLCNNFSFMNHSHGCLLVLKCKIINFIGHALHCCKSV